MSKIRTLLDRNQQFASNHTRVPLGPPDAQVLVVTCLDHRVDPAEFLGLELGDAPVVRNTGGRVNQSVIDDVAFFAFVAEQMFGRQGAGETLFEVAVVHHTQCGSGFLADDGFRRRYAELIGADESDLRDRAVLDPAVTVATDVERLRASAAIGPRVAISGHVYDVDTGLVETVVPIADAYEERAAS